MLPAHLAQHPVVQRQLGVGAGTDPEVIAELPVIEVVAAQPFRAGKGRGFVIAETGGGEPGFDRFLHVGALVAFRQFGREGGEAGVRFQRQLIAGKVRRLEGERLLDVGQRLGMPLAGQAVHQVEVEGLEMAGGEFGGMAGLVAVVHPAERLQMAVVEALDAEREAGDASGAIAGEAPGLGGAGVGFEGDFGVRRQPRQRAEGGEQFVDGCRRKQAGRAAAEEDADHRPAPDQRQRALQVLEQRGDIFLLWHCAASLVRVEIAVGTFADAPRHMHVERQGRRSAKFERFHGRPWFFGKNGDGAHGLGKRGTTTGRAAANPPRVGSDLFGGQSFQQSGHRLAPVREAVLGVGVEFGGGFSGVRDEEQRVVAEALGAARAGEDFAVPFAFGDDRLRIVGAPAEYQHADEVGAAVVLPGEVGEQLFVIAGVRFRFAGIAGRDHAGGATQGAHAEAGIVGQGRQAAVLRGVAGLGQGVFDKGYVRLFGFGNAELALRDHFDPEWRQQRVEFLDLLGVVRGEDELFHGQLGSGKAWKGKRAVEPGRP